VLEYNFISSVGKLVAFVLFTAIMSDFETLIP